MRLDAETGRYAITSPFFLARPISWVCEKLAGQVIPSAWVPTLNWVSLAAGLILLGYLIADLTYPRSSLRNWWRSRRKFFEVNFHPSSVVMDDKETNVPRFSLRSKKHYSNVSLELMLYENIQFSINKPPILIWKKKPKPYSEGESVDVPVAQIPVSDHLGLGYWGDDGMKPLIGRTGNLVELRARKAGWFRDRVQKYAVFISVGECNVETSARYFYLTEDRHVFTR